MMRYRPDDDVAMVRSQAEEGATMNVVKLKPKNNNTIELNIREGTGSFMCIS